MACCECKTSAAAHQNGRGACGSRSNRSCTQKCREAVMKRTRYSIAKEGEIRSTYQVLLTVLVLPAASPCASQPQGPSHWQVLGVLGGLGALHGLQRSAPLGLFTTSCQTGASCASTFIAAVIFRTSSMPNRHHRVYLRGCPRINQLWPWLACYTTWWMSWSYVRLALEISVGTSSTA